MSERLLIRNGCLLDPSFGRDEILDVAIADGKIVGLAPHIDASGYRVIDATGALVVPGLVDMHTHAYWGGTLLGVNADKVGPRSGVTTWVNCGSSGAATFEGFFHHVINPSRLRIIPFINLSYIGLTQAGNLSIDLGELFDWRFADLRELRCEGGIRICHRGRQIMGQQQRLWCKWPCRAAARAGGGGHPRGAADDPYRNRSADD